MNGLKFWKNRVTIQAPTQKDFNRRFFPTKTPSTETLPLHMKYPLSTLQLLGFLNRALFLQNGLQ
jgi:hypothetical protein